MLGLNEKDIYALGEKYVLYKLDIDAGMYWLFDVEQGSYFDLNESSFSILSQFDGMKSLSQARKEVIHNYSDTRSSEVTKDFDELVTEFISKEVLIKKGGERDG